MNAPGNVTLAELAQRLDELTPGTVARIHHDLFADLFPPGEPDAAAREVCRKFAQAHGCEIENQPGPFSGQGELWFVKNV